MSNYEGVTLIAESKIGTEFLLKNYSKAQFGYTLERTCKEPLTIKLTIGKMFRKSLGPAFVDALQKKFGEKMKVKKEEVNKHVLVVLS
jgi:hypothetical protein